MRFERRKNEDRVVVALSAIPAYEVAAASNGRVRLALRSTKFGQESASPRALDVTALGGALRGVATFTDEKAGLAIVEIDRPGDEQGAVTVEGTNLVWTFGRSPAAKDGGDSARTAGTPSVGHARTLERDQVFPAQPKIETSIHGDDGRDAEAAANDADGARVETTGGERAGFVSHVRAQTGSRYSGRHIDLDLKDADIHNILRLLADVGHVNVVTADDVGGSVTIKMNDVPWDQALDVVLSAKSLGMVRTGNLIRVAPLAKLQAERELRVAQQRSELDLMPMEMRLIPISYATALGLQQRAHEILSPRGSISVDERTNTLIARDVSGNINRIEELVRSLDTQTPEVLVEARIVEATSNYLRDVGIQWGGDSTFSEATGNPTGLAFPSRFSAAGGATDGNAPTAGLSPFANSVPTPNYAVNLPAAVGTGQGGALGLAFGSIDNNSQSELASIGGRNERSRPHRVQPADSDPEQSTGSNSIRETPIPFSQVSAQGVQTTFQEAKLQLLVTPHVTADGGVSMHLKVNRDEPNFNQTAANGAPTILKREAETDLLVMDGHTAVIGGIFTREHGTERRPSPLLRRHPDHRRPLPAPNGQ